MEIQASCLESGKPDGQASDDTASGVMSWLAGQ
jgi:hypothetical protein